MILHICEFTSDFFIHINEEPKKYCKLANDFFQFMQEGIYIYCTFSNSQVVFF
jgi:hypothetical protein